MDTPIRDCYWVAEGQLLAGEYPGAAKRAAARAKLEAFVTAGIRTFIDLTENRDGLESYEPTLAALAAERQLDLRYRRFAVPDMGLPGEGVMAAILSSVNGELEVGRPVYVHCWGGIGRTGTAIGCWLVQRGMNPNDALERIRALRSLVTDRGVRSPETDAQCDYVRSWRDSSSPASLTAPSFEERCRGAFLGLATGDALGTTLEFKKPGTFTPVTDMVGGGPFRLAPGAWTDDTSMALCLAESLIECGGFDPADQLRRYLRWYRDGHHSSKGYCFDIGNTVREALATFERGGDSERSGATHDLSAGNGSIMRLAPVAIRFATEPEHALALAGDSSKTTHAHPEAVDACRYFAGLIVGALQGRGKDELLAPRFSPATGRWPWNDLVAPIQEVASGSFQRRQPPEIKGTGYVTRSLEAALWAFATTESFEAGALRAVNLGDDADTTGAVFGQLAGAYYGVSGIPEHWRQKIAQRTTIEDMARGLVRQGRRLSSSEG